MALSCQALAHNRTTPKQRVNPAEDKVHADLFQIVLLCTSYYRQRDGQLVVLIGEMSPYAGGILCWVADGSKAILYFHVA